MPATDSSLQSLEQRVQLLEDELAVRRVLGEYFVCLDRRDFDGFRRVFANDAVGVYGGVGEVTWHGLTEIVEGLRRVSQFLTTSHITSSQRIGVTGDEAQGDTQCVCFNQTRDATTMMVRGVRYVDQLARSPEGWSIVHRRHLPLWELQHPVVPPTYLRGDPLPNAASEA